MSRLRERPTHVRLMGEDGVQYPLWSRWGQIPEDADWLSDNLGLNADVIDRLKHWQARWERRGPDHEDYKWLESEGRELIVQLQRFSPDITFEFVPDRLRE